MDPNGNVNPPMWYINDPHMGPTRKPMPAAISIIPMFISRSESFELDTTIASVATEFIPEPKPPINWNTNEKKRKTYAFVRPSVQ